MIYDIDIFKLSTVISGGFCKCLDVSGNDIGQPLYSGDTDEYCYNLCCIDKKAFVWVKTLPDHSFTSGKCNGFDSISSTNTKAITSVFSGCGWVGSLSGKFHT